MSRFIDVFWPTLEAWKPSEEAEIREENIDDLAAIDQADWSRCGKLALQEARRLMDFEEDRRRSTEAKGTTHLLFVGALVPLLTYLESALWAGTVGTAPKWLSMQVILVAVLYLMGAGLWAFRIMEVSTFHQLDVPDLLEVWKVSTPLPTLVRAILKTVRRNRAVINRKVSCLTMSQMFLQRAFLAFGALLVLEISWETWQALEKPGLLTGLFAPAI